MEKHYVEALRKGNEQQIKVLYYRYRKAIYRFAQAHGMGTDDAMDLYQDSFLIMHRHAVSGKLYGVNSSFKTYLFGVFKHLMYHQWKQEGRTITLDLSQLGGEELQFQEDSPTDEERLLSHSFKELGENCRKLLTLALYRGLTNGEIAQLRGYENEAVARSHKSRCIKKLKEIVNRNKKRWTNRNS